MYVKTTKMYLTSNMEQQQLLDTKSLDFRSCSLMLIPTRLFSVFPHHLKFFEKLEQVIEKKT